MPSEPADAARREHIGTYWIYEAVPSDVQPNDDRIDVFLDERGERWPVVAPCEAGMRVDYKDGCWCIRPWAMVRSVWFAPSKGDEDAV